MSTSTSARFGHRRRQQADSAGGFATRVMERGVTLVEFAFVSVIMFSLVAATVDYGRGWQSGMAITEAARAGARVGSSQAKNSDADFNALMSIRASLTASDKLNDVELVVIYRADNANGVPPSSCVGTGSFSGTCNVFTKAQLEALTLSSFNIVDNSPNPPTGNGCAKSGYAPRAGWCPTSRVNSPQGSAEYIGVYIRYRQNNLFPLSGPSRTISRTAVMRLEPPTM